MAWIARRLRPRSGWGLLILALLTGMVLATAVAVAEWVSGSDLLVPTAVAALLVGRWAGYRSWRPVTHTLFGLVSGLLASLLLASGGPRMLLAFMDQWQGWVQAAVWGGASRDPAIFLLYTLFLMWGVSFYAGWRGSQPFGGLSGFLPAVALSAVSVFFSEQGALPLFTGVLCWLLLVGLGDLIAHKETWESRLIDYASDLEFDVVLAAGLIAVVLVLVGALLPAFSVDGFVRWVSETFSRPAERVEAEAERLFSGVRPPQHQGDLLGSGGSNTLPLEHLIGGSPDLGREEVFRVLGDDLTLPYWRGVTYDLYTGWGWQITIDSEEIITGSLSLINPPLFQVVAQRVNHVREGGGSVYAVGDVARVEDGETTARWRGPDDLAGLLVSSAAYTVTSMVALPAPDDLRSAAAVYPPVMAEYLQLPAELPERVRDLANEVTEGATTPYDRAIRLERYLRGFPYSLDVPSPPPDRDVADYFLFDLGEGYCDYYATAFVVMARAVGLPARLAIGYVGGRSGSSPWDRVVMESNGHSWPEVFFSGWGWVRFEPTSSRPEVREHLEDDVAATSEDRIPRRPMGARRSLLWAGAFLALAMVLGLAAWAWRRSANRSPDTGLSSAWRMLVQVGDTLGSSHQPGQTVFDYAAALSSAVAERAADARWRQKTWFARSDEVKRMLDLFAATYSCYLYGGGSEELELSVDLWRELARMRSVPLIPRRNR